MLGGAGFLPSTVSLLSFHRNDKLWRSVSFRPNLSDISHGTSSAELYCSLSSLGTHDCKDQRIEIDSNFPSCCILSSPCPHISSKCHLEFHLFQMTKFHQLTTHSFKVNNPLPGIRRVSPPFSPPRYRFKISESCSTPKPPMEGVSQELKERRSSFKRSDQGGGRVK